MLIQTASWFTKSPDTHFRIGISRGMPRGQPAGFRMYRKLAPGPWYSSAEPDEYVRRYHAEILAPLDPEVVAAELTEMAAGKVPVMLCFEQANGRDWCHRSLAAEWLADALDEPVSEFGHEHLPQPLHPLTPPSHRR
jgi:hypothetical protein